MSLLSAWLGSLSRRLFCLRLKLAVPAARPLTQAQVALPCGSVPVAGFGAVRGPRPPRPCLLLPSMPGDSALLLFVCAHPGHSLPSEASGAGA